MKKVLLTSAAIAALAVSASSFAMGKCAINFNVGQLTSKSGVAAKIANNVYNGSNNALQFYLTQQSVQFVVSNPKTKQTVAISKPLAFGSQAVTVNNIPCDSNYAVEAILSTVHPSNNAPGFASVFASTITVPVGNGTANAPVFYAPVIWQPQH